MRDQQNYLLSDNKLDPIHIPGLCYYEETFWLIKNIAFGLQWEVETVQLWGIILKIADAPHCEVMTVFRPKARANHRVCSSSGVKWPCRLLKAQSPISHCGSNWTKGACMSLCCMISAGTGIFNQFECYQIMNHSKQRWSICVMLRQRMTEDF